MMNTIEKHQRVNALIDEINRSVGINAPVFTKNDKHNVKLWSIVKDVCIETNNIVAALLGLNDGDTVHLNHYYKILREYTMGTVFLKKSYNVNDMTNARINAAILLRLITVLKGKALPLFSVDTTPTTYVELVVHNIRNVTLLFGLTEKYVDEQVTFYPNLLNRYMTINNEINSLLTKIKSCRRATQLSTLNMGIVFESLSLIEHNVRRELGLSQKMSMALTANHYAICWDLTLHRSTLSNPDEFSMLNLGLLDIHRAIRDHPQFETLANGPSSVYANVYYAIIAIRSILDISVPEMNRSIKRRESLWICVHLFKKSMRRADADLLLRFARGRYEVNPIMDALSIGASAGKPSMVQRCAMFI